MPLLMPLAGMGSGMIFNQFSASSRISAGVGSKAFDKPHNLGWFPTPAEPKLAIKLAGVEVWDPGVVRGGVGLLGPALNTFQT